MKFEDQRHEYLAGTFSIEIAESNSPFKLLERWFKEAIAAAVVEPNAMALATASLDGHPSSRMVLLKEIDDKGLIFYTPYSSRKGIELNENPFASATFYWHQLERQITVEGKVIKVSREKNFEYFSTRPRGSQIGAWASRQGASIESRETLEASYRYYEEEFSGKKVLPPPHWGGYQILPEMFIFWQGGKNRMHDRYRYIKNAKGGWQLDRIAP